MSLKKYSVRDGPEGISISGGHRLGNEGRKAAKFSVPATRTQTYPCLGMNFSSVQEGSYLNTGSDSVDLGLGLGIRVLYF